MHNQSARICKDLFTIKSTKTPRRVWLGAVMHTARFFMHLLKGAGLAGISRRRFWLGIHTGNTGENRRAPDRKDMAEYRYDFEPGTGHFMTFDGVFYKAKN